MSTITGARTTRPLFLTLFLLALCCATAQSSLAQERSVALRVNRPLMAGGYDGVVGLGFTYSHPLSSDWLLRSSVEYDRLRLGSTSFRRDNRERDATANVYTARLDLGYVFSLGKSLEVVPASGLGYTQVGYRAAGLDSAENYRGVATWLAITSSYSVAHSVAVGVSLGHQGEFLWASEEEVLGGAYQRFSLFDIGVTLSYEW